MKEWFNKLDVKFPQNRWINEKKYVQMYLERYDSDLKFISHHIGPDVNFKAEFLFSNFYEDAVFKNIPFIKIVESTAFLWENSLKKKEVWRAKKKR